LKLKILLYLSRVAGLLDFSLKGAPGAYVEACQSPHYVITSKELAHASTQITALSDLLRTACEERLAEWGEFGCKGTPSREIARPCKGFGCTDGEGAGRISGLILYTI
jgi:hypothetical protein